MRRVEASRIGSKERKESAEERPFKGAFWHAPVGNEEFKERIPKGPKITRKSNPLEEVGRHKKWS